MGFFSKLFEKKECSICGGEIGLLGNRKLEDGNCCKVCAGKLSPWFEDRRSSTVAQIQEQLAYREQNKANLQNFRVSQVIGEYYKMYIEAENGIPTRFFVTTSDDYMAANPDIISFRDLMSCVIDIHEDQTELKKDDANGNKVSYSPPRFQTEYDYYVNMQISGNPYFDDIRIKLNSSTVTLETQGGTTGSFLGVSFTSAPVNISNPREKERHQKFTTMCQQIEQIVQRSRMTPEQAASGVDPVQSLLEQMRNAPNMETALRLQEQLASLTVHHSNKNAILIEAAQAVAAVKLREDRGVAAPAAPAAAPAAPKFCPACGAPTDGGKFCQYCGAKF